MIIIEFECRAQGGPQQLGEIRVVHDDERVVGVNILNISLFELGTAKEALVVQPDDIDRLIRSVGQLDHRTTHEDRHCKADAIHATYRIFQVVGQRNRARGGVDPRVHDPHAGANISDRRISTVQDTGEQRGHLHHQKHGEHDADQQCEELALVIHQQLEADAQNAAVLHGSRDSATDGPFHQPPPSATYRATVSW